ncbi:MAG: glycoside hydrolase family 97 protein [Gemmataceae bacterium]|nr:glycoside hydrolase family 97 protein [Gemmataceae bacterium]
MASPDGAVQFQLLVRDKVQLSYRITFRNNPVIESSALGILLDGVDLTRGVETAKPETFKINEKYPWRGVHAEALNHCNGVKIPSTHSASKLRYTLEVRAFNDGVAFRHIIPASDRPRVPDEATAFILPVGSTVWYHDLEGHYEGVHERKEIAEVKAGEWAAPPVTFKLPGNVGYASITEAALVNYAGMALEADGRRGFTLALGHKHPPSYPFRLRFKVDIERLCQPAAIAGTITSSWRVILVGGDLNTLVNSDVIHNLCPPPDPKLFPKGMHTEWLRPGRAVWKYMDGGDSTLEGMKEFCRLAGELGFEHNVVEGFWRRFSDAELRELVDYGKKHGVGIWLWERSKTLRDPAARRAFFQKCRDMGIVGVKLDFFDHDAKEVIDYYHVLLRECAEHRLMVNFHGSTKPTGEARTWPNELVRESVRGMESSRLKTRARHDATLPFTRFLAGHADYTAVHVGARRADTSWAHQAATAVVFTAPLFLYAAHPKNILDNPCGPMLKSIPSVWDETIVLPCSTIGEVAAFARRSGETWFLAIVNGPDALTLKLPLSFLRAGKHEAHVIRDDPAEAAAVRFETTTVNREDWLTIPLGAGGGFVGRFDQGGGK